MQRFKRDSAFIRAVIPGKKDILYKQFDPTLEKYKSKAALSKVTPVTPITPNQKQKPKLDELWDKYS